MIYSLPKVSKEPVSLMHFPTRHQAFIFRVCEYVSKEKIAKILGTDVQTVAQAMEDMGLHYGDVGDVWLKRGYISIIKSKSSMNATKQSIWMQKASAGS